jgi:hypothetical protein
MAKGVLLPRLRAGFCGFKSKNSTPVCAVTSNSIDSGGKLEKNGKSSYFELFYAVYGGKVKNAVKTSVFGALAFLGAGLLLTGCKSAPELAQANALALIQAKYDQTPPVGANIAVYDLGMRQGVTARYWERTTIYPNRFWADFTLTPEGKKVLKLQKGGDVILWRPGNADDKNYSIVVVTVAANHLKARDIKEIQDETGGGKGADFTESIVWDGVPGPLQDIAHNPGNKLSAKRHAEFVLDGGAWKLQAIN